MISNFLSTIYPCWTVFNIYSNLFQNVEINSQFVNGSSWFCFARSAGNSLGNWVFLTKHWVCQIKYPGNSHETRVTGKLTWQQSIRSLGHVDETRDLKRENWGELGKDHYGHCSVCDERNVHGQRHECQRYLRFESSRWPVSENSRLVNSLLWNITYVLLFNKTRIFLNNAMLITIITIVDEKLTVTLKGS